jgi:hypothetical protein
MVDVTRSGVAPEVDNNRIGGEPSLASLIGGIVTEVQELSRQQLALLKAEVANDIRQTREVAVSWAAAIALAVVGALMLCLMLVYLLNYAIEWPLFACFGVVGLVMAAIGAGLFYAGKKKLDSFSLVPTESIHALKENVQCLTNAK